MRRVGAGLVAAFCFVGVARAVALVPDSRVSQDKARLTVANVLARVGAYLEEYEQKFSAVVAEEEYIQRVRGPGGGFGRALTDRVTRGDMLLIRLAGSDWVGFRDIFEVNGVSVRDHDQRLQTLFLDAPPQLLARASEITNESSRFNLGSIRRTINLPTMALTYVRVANQRRSTFRLGGVDAVPSLPAEAVILEFTEKEKPTIIRSPTRGDQPAEGRFWIDPDSGRVLRSELKVGNAAPARTDARATIGVTYGPNAKVEMWVPVRMSERYTTSVETIDALAIYSNHRKFMVDSRVVIK